MSWDAYMKGKAQFASLGGHTMATPNILKETLMEGKVRVYEDDKRTVLKTEILAKEGTVEIYKEYFPAHNIWKFKKIDVFSLDKEPLGTIDVFTDMEQALHPHCRFMYMSSPIGSGTGDIDRFIAQKLLNEDNADPRFTAGSELDHEVTDTIIKLLQRKVI